MRLNRDSDRQSVEVDDNNRQLIDYYLGEGYTAEEDTTEVVSFPRVFDGERYVEPVEVEQLPEGQFAEPTGPAESVASGQQFGDGVEHPADGSLSPEVSNP